MDVCEISLSNASNGTGPVASEVHPEALGQLSFAVRPVHSTTNNEAESHCSPVLQSNIGQEHGLEKVIPEAKENQVGTSSGWLIPLQSLAPPMFNTHQ